MHYEINYENWKKVGYPDVVLGPVDLKSLFNKESIEDDYIIVYTNNSHYIQKGLLLHDRNIIIKIRKELAQELGLEEKEEQIKEYYLDLKSITSYILQKIMWAYIKHKENIK